MQRYDWNSEDGYMDRYDDGLFVLNSAAQAEIARLTAERDQALARLAAVQVDIRERAAMHVLSVPLSPSNLAEDRTELANKIRALPIDAEAALQRVVDAAWNEAVEACAWSFDDDTTAQQARQTILALKRPEASHE